MQLSIIIPTYKRLDILKETYHYLINALENIPAEIIIVNDDKSIDQSDIRSALNIENHNIIVVDNKISGAAGARNLGAKLAKGEILLFLDDDILINNAVIKSIFSLHQKYKRMLLVPVWEYSDLVKDLLIKTTFGRFRLANDYASTKGEKHRELPQERSLYEIDSIASFCLSVKREHYFELNGMDERFAYAGCEDQDFGSRAKVAGFTLLLDENNIVMHNELDRIKKENWLQRQFNGVQGFVFLCQKFPERKNTALWIENMPIQKQDPLNLKIKKIAKFIIRQKLPLFLFNKLVVVCEIIYLPEPKLFKLYAIQAGIYLNKGFTKSYNLHVNSYIANNKNII